MYAFTIQPLLPTWLTMAIIAALVLALLHGAAILARRGVGRTWTLILSLLRAAAVAVFALILLQPVVSITQPERSPPHTLVLVDTSRSMADRKGVAKAIEPSPLRTALDERYILDWYAFDQAARRLDSANLAQLNATGEATRLDEGLTAAYRHARATGVRPARVLLVSDGHDQSAIDPAEIARRFQLKVDVLPAASASGEAPTQINIANVQGAHRVLLGSDTQVRVRVERSSLDASGPAQLIVHEGGHELLRRAVKFPRGAHEVMIDVVHRPATSGAHVYEFQITGGHAASTKYRHPIHVVDAKHEILVLEDTWRWEFRYLQRVLEEDPSFRFTAFLARGEGTYLQLGSPDRQLSLVGLPQSAADLAGYDLLMLGDVDLQRLSNELVAAIRSTVADEGKSLVVIAGPRLGRIAARPELHEMLPVELTTQSGEPIAGPIAVRWPIEARESPFFFQFDLPAEELPPLDQIYPVLRRRAGATVLLEAVSERNAYGPNIVMAEQMFGRGRVLFIGADTLWKWHTLAPDGPALTPYALFWQQALRALASSRNGRGNVQLWLTADRTRSMTGKRVALQLEATGRGSPTDARIEANIVTPEGQRLPMVFSPDQVKGNSWHMSFTPLAAGEYRVLASLVNNQPQPLAVSQQVLEVVADSKEASDKDVDFSALARLASATGGNVIDPSDPATWPKENGQPPSMAITRSYALWENFSLIIVLSLLLGGDWLIRAVRGLT